MTDSGDDGNTQIPTYLRNWKAQVSRNFVALFSFYERLINTTCAIILPTVVYHSSLEYLCS
jgi:hypothetical protein